MKFTCEVNVNLNRKALVALFEDPDNLVHWQEGFQRLEPVQGEPGAVGSITKMWYQMETNQMVIEETILENNLPDRFSGEYVSSHTVNTMTHIFEPTSENTTKYTAHVDYTWLAFFLRVITFIKPKMMQAQVQKWMDNFKHFAEHGPSGERY